jgi:hypothetical protein
MEQVEFGVDARLPAINAARAGLVSHCWIKFELRDSDREWRLRE